MKSEIFKQCQNLFPEWLNYSETDFEFDDPKGFSSFTMGIRSNKAVHPKAVLYRRLEGKDNAILNFETEKEVFMTLSDHGIAPDCHYYDRHCRIEAFYDGRTLVAADLFKAENLRQIANQLYGFHQLSPVNLPQKMFFEMLHRKWGKLARHVLENKTSVFPANEQQMCEQLRDIYSNQTLEMVMQCIPDDELTFCHNDTYHGNIMKLDSGKIKLLDFEFSCLNNKAYDFSNLFAETVMRHQLAEYPYFKITEPQFSDRELGMLIDFYLDNETFENQQARLKEHNRLLKNTKQMLILSDYKYAMAALPLAVNPVQKIRFIPYALQRFQKFQKCFRDSTTD